MPENEFNPAQMKQSMPAVNPLAQYYRQPKIYIKLPSKGNFYPQGSLDVSETGEYAVYAMTAKDELMMKTPDALLNGQSTVEVIKSCIPSIKNPWQMPSVDLDACLVAIRIASFGENMDVATNCPKCGHQNEYQFNLIGYLEEIAQFEYISSIQIGELKINLRPFTYKEVTQTVIKAIEQRRIFDIIQNEDLSDEDKVSQFGQSFMKLTELTVDTVAKCIESVETPTALVTDRKQIDEFINNSPTEVFEKVNDTVKTMKETIDIKSQKVVCEEEKCKHEFVVDITMDQADFFGVRS